MKFHIPKSILSGPRTIQRKYIASRLHALPSAGEGTRYFGSVLFSHVFSSTITSRVITPSTVGSSGLSRFRTNAPTEPYSLRILVIDMAKLDDILAVCPTVFKSVPDSPGRFMSERPYE